jgi:hypothetical protein
MFFEKFMTEKEPKKRKNTRNYKVILAATLAAMPASILRAQQTDPVVDQGAGVSKTTFAQVAASGWSFDVLGGGGFVPSIPVNNIHVKADGVAATVNAKTPTVLMESAEVRVTYRPKDSNKDSNLAVYGSLGDTTYQTGNGFGLNVTSVTGINSFNIPAVNGLPSNVATYAGGVISPQLPGPTSIQSIASQLASPQGYTFNMPSVTPAQVAIGGLLAFGKDLPALLDKYHINGEARAQILSAAANPQNLVASIDKGFAAAHQAIAMAQAKLNKINGQATIALNQATIETNKAGAKANGSLTNATAALTGMDQSAAAHAGAIASQAAAQQAAGAQTLNALAMHVPEGPGRNALLTLAKTADATTGVGASLFSSGINDTQKATQSSINKLQGASGDVMQAQSAVDGIIGDARKIQSAADRTANALLKSANKDVTVGQAWVDKFMQTPINLGSATFSAKSPEMQSLVTLLAKNNLGTIDPSKIFSNAIQGKSTTLNFTPAQIASIANSLVGPTKLQGNADLQKAEIGGILYLRPDNALYFRAGVGAFMGTGSGSANFASPSIVTQPIGYAFNTNYKGLVGLAGKTINNQYVTFATFTQGQAKASVRLVGLEATLAVGTDGAADARALGAKIPEYLEMPTEFYATGGLGRVTSAQVTGVPAGLPVPNFKGKTVPVGSFGVMTGFGVKF